MEQPESRTFPVKDLHASAFISADESVINHRGDNFYRACGALVVEEPGGATSSCVKRWGHPGHIHEDYDGVQVSEWNFDLVGLTLPQAVRASIAQACILGLNGSINYERRDYIAKILLEKIDELASLDDL